MSFKTPQAVVKEEPPVTAALAREHGLTDEEYQRIIQILGRTPNFTELGIFSVMWSEHCSYKNSILLLKTLPRSGGRLLVAAGEENAGLVDIGDGLAVAFKIESHNHPSAVEPYQGAATGVGGILRDIFSMGARPIAVLNSLRFGPLTDQRVQYLFKGVVKGIADYGNSFGVPTVAGEVYFDESYRGNPLVNAMAVGIVEHHGVAKATARGKGNSVMIVGSSTGRDGIHGATFASEEISEKSEAKRPSVQVGDPFTEKLLLEATLEAIKTGYVVGVQDMGAAGITCSTSEMSAKGNAGMTIDLSKVPLREDGMTAYEIMLSESQERMLFIVEKGREEDVNKIFKKWDLHAERIGSVEDDALLRISVGGKVVATVPPEPLVLGGGAPVYKRQQKKPGYVDELRRRKSDDFAAPADLATTLLDMIGRPNIASKRWVYEQYDSMVRTNSVLTADADAAVVRIKGTKKALAVKTDCNGRFVYLDPYVGTEIAVAESARNVVCTGATPVAITNCLNFGNPYDPEIYWQFAEAIRGMGDACRTLGTPVTGGNVSFYNEHPDGAVYPTPVIGMLGILDDADRTVNARFKQPGDSVFELGENYGEIGGSEYQHQRTGAAFGDVPRLDWQRELRLHQTVIELVSQGLLQSAHDVSEGGLLSCLSESLIAAEGSLGLEIESGFFAGGRIDILGFSESQSRVVVSCRPESEARVQAACKAKGQAIRKVGVLNTRGLLKIAPGVEVPVAELAEAFEGAIPSLIGSQAAGG